MATRISSLQSGYTTGDLSLYPTALDSKESLYEVANNATTKLKQSLTYSGKKIVVESTEGFPSQGLLRVTDGDHNSGELIYYGSKTSNTFKDLARAFAGSRQNQWSMGAFVSNAVCAEHHNAVKDAVIKLEVNLGLQSNPEDTSLNGILKKQENKFLVPKPLFRAYPTSGGAPLTVSFHNFSLGMAPNILNGPLIRCFWDFGDGTTSTEKNPVHTYTQEGSYSVELVVTSILGGQGIVTKNNYILVDNKLKPIFFYIKNSPDRFPPLKDKNTLKEGRSYSEDVNGQLVDDNNPSIFEFIDQTDGPVKERYWNFNGKGRIIKRFYNSQQPIFTDGEYFTVVIDKNSGEEFSINDSIGAIVYTNGGGDVVTKFRKVAGVQTTELYRYVIFEGTIDTYSASIGRVLPEEVDSYTEQNPNIHTINFIYKYGGNNSVYNPSLYVIFSDQNTKKAFLKEEVIID